MFIWEGETVADTQFMDRFNEVGVLETSPAFDRTLGWRAAFDKDLYTFRKNLTTCRPSASHSVESAVDLRSRGMRAPNRHAARATARRWVAEQESERG